MERLLNALVLKLLVGQPCPSCGAKFTSATTLERSGGRLDVICPTCGQRFDSSRFQQQNSAPEELYPDNPAPEPPQERVRHFQTADGDFALDIPRTGKSGCLYSFALLWLSFCAFIFLIPRAMGGPVPPPFILFELLFFGIGFLILFLGIKMKHTRHRLFLDRDRLLYQSELFNRKRTVTMQVREVADVAQRVFYTQNYQAVRRIEISDIHGKSVKFGAQLTPDDKRWIVFRLRQELRARGCPNLPIQQNPEISETDGPLP